MNRYRLKLRKKDGGEYYIHQGLASYYQVNIPAAGVRVDVLVHNGDALVVEKIDPDWAEDIC